MARNFPAGVPGDNSHVRAKGKYHSSSDGAVIYKMQIVFVLPVEVILDISSVFFTDFLYQVQKISFFSG